MKIDVRFGAIVKPVRQGKPLPPTQENWETVLRLQEAGKLPKDPNHTIHIGHPDGHMLIITPPEADAFSKDDADYWQLLGDPKHKPQAVEV